MSGKHPLPLNQAEVKWEILICVLVFYVTWILFQAVRQRDMLGLRRLTSKLFSSSQTADNNTNSTDKTTKNASDKPPPLRREKTLPVSSSSPQTSISRSDSTSQITSESPKEHTKTIKRRAPQPLRQCQSSSVLTSVGSKTAVKNIAGKSSESLTHVKRKAPQPVKQSQSSSALSSQVAPSVSNFADDARTQSDLVPGQNERTQNNIVTEENESIIPQTVINHQENVQNKISESNIADETKSSKNRTKNDAANTTKEINKNQSITVVKKKPNESQNITKNENSENKTKNTSTVLHDEIKHVFQFQLSQSKSKLDLKKKTDTPPSIFPTVLSEIITPSGNNSNENSSIADVSPITQQVSLGATTKIEKNNATQEKNDILPDICGIGAIDTKEELSRTKPLENYFDESLITQINLLSQNASDRVNCQNLIISSNGNHNNVENKIEINENNIILKQNEKIGDNVFDIKSEISPKEKCEIQLNVALGAESLNKIIDEVDHVIKNTGNATPELRKINDNEQSSGHNTDQLNAIVFENKSKQIGKTIEIISTNDLNDTENGIKNSAEIKNSSESENYESNKIYDNGCSGVFKNISLNHETEIKTVEVTNIEKSTVSDVLSSIQNINKFENSTKLDNLEPKKKICDASEISCNDFSNKTSAINDEKETNTVTDVLEVKFPDNKNDHDVKHMAEVEKVVVNDKLCKNDASVINEIIEVALSENSRVDTINQNVTDLNNTTKSGHVDKEDTCSSKISPILDNKEIKNNKVALEIKSSDNILNVQELEKMSNNTNEESSKKNVSSVDEKVKVTVLEKSNSKILSGLNQNETDAEKMLESEKLPDKTNKSRENKETCYSLEQINGAIHLSTAEVKLPTKILKNENLSDHNKKTEVKVKKTIKPKIKKSEINKEPGINNSPHQAKEEINSKTMKENKISEIAQQTAETHSTIINSEMNKSIEKPTVVKINEIKSNSSHDNNLKMEEKLLSDAMEQKVETIDNHVIKENKTEEKENENKKEKSEIDACVENSAVTSESIQNKQTNKIKNETSTKLDDKIVENNTTKKESLKTNGHDAKQIASVEKKEISEINSSSKITKVGSQPVGAPATNGERKLSSAGAALKSRSIIPPVTEPVKIGFGMLKSRPKNEPIKKKKKKSTDSTKKNGIFVESQISVSVVNDEIDSPKKETPAITTDTKNESETQKVQTIISQENKASVLTQCDDKASLKPVLPEKSCQLVSNIDPKPCDITYTDTTEISNNSTTQNLNNVAENSSACDGKSHKNKIDQIITEASPIKLLPELKSCELSEESIVKNDATIIKEDALIQTIISTQICNTNPDSDVIISESISNCSSTTLEQEMCIKINDNKNIGVVLNESRAQVVKELPVELIEKSTSEASISLATNSPTKENKSLEVSLQTNENDVHIKCKTQPILEERSLKSEPGALSLEQSIVVSPSSLDSYCESQENIVQNELEQSSDVLISVIDEGSLNSDSNLSTLAVDTPPLQPPSGQGFGVVRANTGRKLEDDRYRTEVEVFFRAGALQQLECQRDERLQDRVTRLQARCRGYLARRRFAKRKVQEVAVRCIQRNVRRFLSVRDWPWWRLLIRVAPLLNVHRAEEELRTKTEELETLRAKLDKVETERTRLKQDTDRLEARLSELSVALSEEHSAATLASERLEAESAERIRLQQELDHVQTRHGELQAASERLEMELLFCRAAEMNGTTEDEGECDEGASPQLRQRLERAHRELALAKRRLTQQHEDDLEQMLGLKKTMEKKLADAYEEVEEQRQVAAQWKRKAQRVTSEGNDSRLLLEEHAARNALLEKRQRKFDADLQALQEALRQEKAQRERAQRERDIAAAEKSSAEQNLVGCRLELEMREEKVASLSRELEELQFGGAAEEEVAALRKARHSLELKLKEQEEELDDLAGQVSLLEQAKLRLEMSLEQQRKETRREFSQRDDELEEVRANAHKKVKALESQLEAEHEERTRLLRERHELERRLTEAAEAARGRAPEDEQALARLRRDLRHTKALLRDAHTMLDKYKNEAPGKGQIRQLRHQLEDAEAARTAALRARQVAETELRETQATLEEASRARAEAEDRAAAAVRERTEARGQLEENEEEMAEVLRKYRAAVAQVSQEQSALQESAVQLQALEAERNSLKEQLAELAARVESVEGETVSSLTQRRLEMKVRELESRLELEQTTRTRLETQISRLKDATEKLQGEGDAARTREAQAQEASRRLQRQIRELRETEAGHAAKEAEWARRRRELELRTEAAEQEASTARTDLRLALQRVEDLQQAMAGELNSSASEEETEGESDSDESIESFLHQHRTPLRSTSHLTDTFELDFSCRSPEGQSDPGESAGSLNDEIKTNESQA